MTSTADLLGQPLIERQRRRAERVGSPRTVRQRVDEPVTRRQLGQGRRARGRGAVRVDQHQGAAERDDRVLRRGGPVDEDAVGRRRVRPHGGGEGGHPAHLGPVLTTQDDEVRVLGVIGDRHQRVAGAEVGGSRPRPVRQQARFPRRAHLVSAPPAHGRRPVGRGVDLIERAGGDHRRASPPDGQPVRDLLPCGQGEEAELVVVDTGTVVRADRCVTASVTAAPRTAGPHGAHHPAGRREPHAPVEGGHEPGDRVPVRDGRREVGQDVDRHAPGAVGSTMMPDGEEPAVPVRDHHPVLRVEVPVDPAEQRALGQLHLRQHRRGVRMEELDRWRERGGRGRGRAGRPAERRQQGASPR